jgi:hypothetical protein
MCRARHRGTANTMHSCIFTNCKSFTEITI